MSDGSVLEKEALGRAKGRRICGDESGGNADEDEGVGSREEDAVGGAGEVEEEDDGAAQLFFGPQAGRRDPVLPSMLVV